MALKVAIIAGEPSGDMQAAGLIKALKEQSSEPIEFMGIGSEQMAREGFKSSYNMDILSVGGFGIDVILAIPRIYLLYKQITKKIIEFQPDVFIGVDAPDFNFHVEKKLKEHGVKTVHYISPTIWAWRYERIFKIKKTTDLMLCIFPMEEELYIKENIKAKFIGNPLADKIELNIDKNKYRHGLLSNSSLNSNKNLNINEYTTIFTILVGSRKAEIKRLAHIFIKACNIIAKRIVDCVFLFPFAKNSTYNAFLNIINSGIEVDFQYKVLLDLTDKAIKASDLVLTKSGTVTLEVALCKKPMIISYKVSRLTEWILRHKLKIKYVGQPNILLDEEVVKELLQDEATAENLANEMLNLYNDKKRQDYIISRFYELHHLLKHDASNIAAKTILEFIG
ncbi:MAG: lipid-A-disaccharide synthase [Neisseriaceae bacterium]